MRRFEQRRFANNILPRIQNKPKDWSPRYRTDNRIINQDEYEKLSTVGNIQTNLLVKILWHTGARTQEILHLTSKDIIFYGNWPHIQISSAKKRYKCTNQKCKAKIRMNWKKDFYECKKCGTSRMPKKRTIPIPMELYHEFEHYRQTMNLDPFERIWTVTDLGSFKRWRYALGEVTGIKNWTWHSFRHTFATRMCSVIPDTSLVCEWCGWENLDMFYKTYRHSDPVTNLNVYLKATNQQVPINMNEIANQNQTRLSGSYQS